MLYIIRGIPGSGKSTYAKKFGCVVFEADQYFMHNGKYEYDQRKIKSAHLWCKNMTEKMLLRGIDVCVANTFVKRCYIKEYVDLAKRINEPVKIIKIVGNHQSIHNIPDDIVNNMKKEWEDYEGEEIYKNM